MKKSAKEWNDRIYFYNFTKVRGSADSALCSPCNHGRLNRALERGPLWSQDTQEAQNYRCSYSVCFEGEEAGGIVLLCKLVRVSCTVYLCPSTVGMLGGGWWCRAQPLQLEIRLFAVSSGTFVVHVMGMVLAALKQFCFAWYLMHKHQLCWYQPSTAHRSLPD